MLFPEQWNMASKVKGEWESLCRDDEEAYGVMLTGFQFGLHHHLEYGLVQIAQIFCISFVISKMGIILVTISWCWD